MPSFNLKVDDGHKKRFHPYQTSQVATLLPAAAGWTIEYIEAKSNSRANSQAGEMSLEKARHRLCRRPSSILLGSTHIFVFTLYLQLYHIELMAF